MRSCNCLADSWQVLAREPRGLLQPTLLFLAFFSSDAGTRRGRNVRRHSGDTGRSRRIRFYLGVIRFPTRLTFRRRPVSPLLDDVRQFVREEMSSVESIPCV